MAVCGKRRDRCIVRAACCNGGRRACESSDFSCDRDGNACAETKIGCVGGFSAFRGSEFASDGDENLRSQQIFHAMEHFRFRCSEYSLVCKRERLHRSKFRLRNSPGRAQVWPSREYHLRPAPCAPCPSFMM